MIAHLRGKLIAKHPNQPVTLAIERHQTPMSFTVTFVASDSVPALVATTCTVAGQTKEDLNRRMAGYTARGLDKTQAFAAVQGEILREFAQMDQRLWQMEQAALQQQGVMQGVQQTRLNRNGGW